jgi:hypothetical protein
MKLSGRTWDVLHAKDDIKAERDPDLPWHHDPGITSWDEVLDRR